MDWKLELVAVPVSDVDRAKRFYTEQVGFNADHDHKISDELRFVQLTPPGSACSIALGHRRHRRPARLGHRPPDGRLRHRRRPRPPRRPAASRSPRSRTSPGAGSCSSRTPTATAGRCSRSWFPAVRLGAVELPVPDAGEERPPLVGGKQEHRARRGPWNLARRSGRRRGPPRHSRCSAVAALAPVRGREVHLHRPPEVGPCQRSYRGRPGRRPACIRTSRIGKDNNNRCGRAARSA